MDIAGKVAIVTGAASGIGRAAVIALAEEGADLVLADVDEERLESVRKEVEKRGRKAVAVRTDVSKLHDVEELRERSLEAFGRVDILMNNAGVHMLGPIERITIEDWQWIVGINLWGVIHGVHVFLPHMMERGSGHIVITGSIAGLIPVGEGSLPYATTKCAVVGLGEGLAAYLRPRGIGVTVVCPGLVRTNIGGSGRLIPSNDGLDALREKVYRAFSDSAPAEQAAFVEQTLQAGIITPAEVAAKTITAIKQNQVRVLTHPDLQEGVLRRAQDVEGMISEQAERRAEFEKTMRALAAADGASD